MYKNYKNKSIKFKNPPKKFNNKIKLFELNSKNKIISKNNYDNIKNILISKKRKQSNVYLKNNKIQKNIVNNKPINNAKNAININNNKRKEQLDNYEMNNLEYALAKKLDKRNIFKIYWSLLKREHSIIFTFITRDDHNIIFVKYSKFIFLLCTDMAMNVFFFSDETMHKMFLDYGKYNFIQQIPQIFYSTLVSKLLETFLCYLSMTDKHYYEIKDYKKNISKNITMRIIKCIKIKIAFFFLFTSFMFLFYWYLITCFCAVYLNTQSAFIKDSLLSFLIGNLIPFVIYLFPSLFRIISLKANNTDLECLYKFSNLIPLF